MSLSRVIVALSLLTLSKQSLGLVHSRIRNICNNEEYLTPTEAPSITCCSGEKLMSGLSLEKFWKDCATPIESETTINVTLWRVFECIVRKHLHENETLSLQSFGEIMTKFYPESRAKDILTKISEVKFICNETLNATEFGWLRAIRRKYYEIEIDVCTKNASEYLAKIKEHPAYESIYMRGGQCLNSDIPISPNYYPLVDDKKLTQTWTTLLETVSENDNLTYGADIQRMCEITSNWLSQEMTTTDEIFQRPDFDKLFTRISPSWANSKVLTLLKEKVNDYWLNAFPRRDSTGFNKTGEENAIINVGNFFGANLKHEFSKIKSEPKAKALIVSCMIPTLMHTSNAESFTYLLCRRPEKATALSVTSE